jgi:hypothetical protein
VNAAPVFCVLRGPRPQDSETPLILLLQLFYPTIQCKCNACIVSPDAGLQKRANFSTLIIGLARTRDQTQATCMAGSGNNRSAIHYDSDSSSFVCLKHSLCQNRIYWQRAKWTGDKFAFPPDLVLWNVNKASSVRPSPAAPTQQAVVPLYTIRFWIESVLRIGSGWVDYLDQTLRNYTVITDLSNMIKIKLSLQKS